jgi:hypothetical protein
MLRARNSDTEDTDPARRGKAGKIRFALYARFERSTDPARHPQYGASTLEQARRQDEAYAIGAPPEERYAITGRSEYFDEASTGPLPPGRRAHSRRAAAGGRARVRLGERPSQPARLTCASDLSAQFRLLPRHVRGPHCQSLTPLYLQVARTRVTCPPRSRQMRFHVRRQIGLTSSNSHCRRSAAGAMIAPTPCRLSAFADACASSSSLRELPA